MLESIIKLPMKNTPKKPKAIKYYSFAYICSKANQRVLTMWQTHTKEAAWVKYTRALTSSWLREETKKKKKLACKQIK